MIEINNQKLQNYGKPFIVAEVGINHNGEVKKAFEMIKTNFSNHKYCIFEQKRTFT